MNSHGRIVLTVLFSAAAFATGNAAFAYGGFKPPSPGLLTALTARKAADRAARADYWNHVATCLNEEGSEPKGCMSDAWDELKEALELAGEQFQARLDLLKILGDGAYDPDIDPKDFSPDVTNPYFPLVPGRTLVYEGMTAEGLEHTEVTTLKDTVMIDGVECRAVRDVVSVGGEVIEDTIDWFAQDKDGNVWYFGEIALNYEDGFVVDIDGSWRTGEDGAKPGIVMPADPKLGDAYRQEFLVNEAEDYAIVLALDETVNVTAGSFMHCRKTLDGTPLEPDAQENKWYASGVGAVKEVDLETGEVNQLIQINGP